MLGQQTKTDSLKKEQLGLPKKKRGLEFVVPFISLENKIRNEPSNKSYWAFNNEFNDT